jgi:hypothetical protein
MVWELKGGAAEQTPVQEVRILPPEVPDPGCGGDGNHNLLGNIEFVPLSRQTAGTALPGEELRTGAANAKSVHAAGIIEV